MNIKGGLRHKKKNICGDQALLQAIWDKHGGPGEVAKKLSNYIHKPIHHQVPINWRSRGVVPHKYVKCVADALNINPIGLNYAILLKLSVDVPPWDKVVKTYDLDEAVVQSILFLRPPGALKK